MCDTDTCYDTVDMDRSIDADLKKFYQILQTVLFNWSEISQDDQIMSVLDIDANKICSTLRDTDRESDNLMIHAKAFSFLLFMLV
jgi:hypothetical protein